MKKPFLHRVIRRFCGERDGSVMVETVICLPLLIWALVATWEFFEVHRYRSAREKATYTLADMLSRETAGITDTYMDNAMRLFDSITNDDGVNQLRISVVRYDADDDKYFIRWSKTRGTGDYSELADADVASSHSELPIMNDGEDLILVESISDYTPTFKVGLGDTLPIDTRLFTKIRFASQLCYEGSYCYQPPASS
ncbi:MULTISPECIES: TadE/TadG family type IV pilus assembly protein [unclassified Roseovarius]|uniref:TadE/TadG family type IV pilus assembly protein n=1 Tax=unclassified Roseovarius TaxID=2614913 RepID=UPI00273EBBB6|nr:MULTISPECIES: TadE/TadG family type IV pilus assembly protein [unclassified Roseovarius]